MNVPEPEAANEYKRGIKDYKEPTSAPLGKMIMKSGDTMTGDMIWYGQQQKWMPNPDQPGVPVLQYFGVAR